MARRKTLNNINDTGGVVIMSMNDKKGQVGCYNISDIYPRG